MEAAKKLHASDTGRAGNPDWYLRPFKAQDEDALLSLYERAFRRPRDRRHWQWKLLGRQAPFSLLWVAAAAAPGDSPEHPERVVGHYGGIPIQVKLGDQTREAVHAVEAMTDPLFRRQGMLTQLGGTAHATWAEAGQWLVTGLPNDQWGTRNRALGYLPVFPLSWLRFPLHLEHALARRHSVPVPLRVVGYLPFLAFSATWRALSSWRNIGIGGARDVTVRLASEGEPVFDAIWAHASPGWRNVQVRDNDWVHWRYLHAAPNPYTVVVAWRVEDGAPKPVGYCAYRVVNHGERKNGYLADLFVARGDASAAWTLVKFALQHLSEQGAGTVMTLAPPGGSLYKLLRRFGFLPTRSETAFGFEIVPLRDEISVQQLSDPWEWHLTGGDFDVI